MLTVSDHRLSFVFVETILDALTGDLPVAQAGRPEVFDLPRYRERFDRAQADPADHADLAPPWPGHARKDNFWRWYLDGRPLLPTVGGATAWRSVVPLRLPAPVQPASNDPAVRLGCEAFAHPWGIALAISITNRAEWTDPTALGESILAARRDPVFTLDGQPAALEDVAQAGLDAVADAVFGPGRRGTRRREPFSVLTFVRVAGDAKARDPRENTALHRLLQAGASFSKTWKSDDPIALEDLRVARLQAQPGTHFLLGTRRGRVIWAPETEGKHTLSCRHRNLLMAAAQVESIAGFAEATAPRGLRGLSAEHRFLASRAMLEIGRLFLGHSFRSGSVKAHIERDPARPAINQLRAALKTEPAL
jgi:hypothetical protein